MNKPNKSQTDKFLSIVKGHWLQSDVNFQMADLRNILRDEYNLFEHYSEENINEWLEETMTILVSEGTLEKNSIYWSYK